MRRFFFAFLFTCTIASASQQVDWSGEKSDWNGFVRYDFSHDGRECIAVLPREAAPGRPWIWRARFFGHEPQTDLALLEQGFHLVYIDVAGLYGNPQAVSHWDSFYRFLTEERDLAPRPALEGMSRGGLIVFNWAAKNPDKVACIYADAPVCDIKSWPGGLGKGTGNSECWKPCLEAYGLTEETVLEFKGNPIDHLEPLAREGVPLLHVCGDADEGVPYEENTQIVAERYQALEGPIQVILKPGVGHHPHSLENPKPIVDFILRNTCGRDPFKTLRGSLSNSHEAFTGGGKGRVAFLGGSITEMEGWRDLVGAILEKRFPETEFDFINAGISSTDSTLGPHRLATDVFHRGPVDLLFVDFSVNDLHNNRTVTESIRGMEGIVRQAKRTCPNIDIVFQLFADPDKMDLLRGGTIPPENAAHLEVARHYGVTVLDQVASVTERVDSGEFTWEMFGGLHPAPFGHRVYSRAIERLFDTAWPPDGASDVVTEVPKPLDPRNYENARFVALEEAVLGEGWTLIPSWTSEDSAHKRERFMRIPMLETTSASSELKLAFSGTGVGLYITAGPDIGILEYRIDEGEPRRVDPFTQWSPRLHIPWALMLEAELQPGEHQLVLRTTGSRNEASTGNSCRIMKFLVK